MGLSGRKGSGKTAVAEYLAECYGFHVVALADPMKQAVRAVFGWSADHTDGDLKETVDPRWGISPRQALQDIGEQWGQFGLCDRFPAFAETTGRLLWTRRALAQCDPREPWIVSDVRYEHEAEAIRADGGFVVRIIRPGHEKSDPHGSESLEWPADEVVVNEGPILKAVAAVVRAYQHRRGSLTRPRA